MTMYTPAVENALIVVCFVSGIGMFVASALGAWPRRAEVTKRDGLRAGRG